MGSERSSRLETAERLLKLLNKNRLLILNKVAEANREQLKCYE